MSDICKVIKVKPWGAGQGDFVEINESDFDPAKGHELYGAAVEAAEPAPRRGRPPKAIEAQVPATFGNSTS